MNSCKEKITLSESEKRLIEAYRLSSPEIRTMINQVLKIRTGEGRIVNGVFYRSIKGAAGSGS